jgi:hypothetical protein
MLGDQFAQIFQPAACEGHCLLVVGSVDPEAAVLRFHLGVREQPVGCRRELFLSPQRIGGIVGIGMIGTIGTGPDAPYGRYAFPPSRIRRNRCRAHPVQGQAPRPYCRGLTAEGVAVQSIGAKSLQKRPPRQFEKVFGQFTYVPIWEHNRQHAPISS